MEIGNNKKERYKTMSIVAKVWDIVHRPVNEVWDAIVNPDKITNYFTSSVSAPIEKGKTIKWEFADYNVTIDINVLEVNENEFISFCWSASGKERTVEIRLMPEGKYTKLEITEGEFELTENEIQKVIQQTQGWTHFICSMKAWMYSGVNLRNGKNLG